MLFEVRLRRARLHLSDHLLGLFRRPAHRESFVGLDHMLDFMDERFLRRFRPALLHRFHVEENGMVSPILHRRSVERVRIIDKLHEHELQRRICLEQFLVVIDFW